MSSRSNESAIERKIDEALTVLKLLGFPRAQQNERSALTLLALLGLTPTLSWKDATAPLIGITPMMQFAAKHYDKPYAPNTRETFRRQTVHQFLQAGLVVSNPDEPERPINSPKWVYQITPEALRLLSLFGGRRWLLALEEYLSSVGLLSEKYSQLRTMARIPLTINSGAHITLSPGGQNILIAKIVNEFDPRFTHGGTQLYVGDAENKFAHFDREAFDRIGLKLEPHGKIPDVVTLDTEMNWLFLIEAVTSHGPIDPKRKAELTELFEKTGLGLIFVTAFLTRKSFLSFLQSLAWETEVWLAESPDHLIHFDGERFLGPYKN